MSEAKSNDFRTRFDYFKRERESEARDPTPYHYTYTYIKPDRIYNVRNKVKTHLELE